MRIPHVASGLSGLSISICILLWGCDCVQIAKGVVLEKALRQPIADVQVSKLPDTDQPQHSQPSNSTDSLGGFRVHFLDGGLFRCPCLQLSFSKKGYVTQKSVFRAVSQQDTVYLEKVK